jgi:hypothetical protein
MGHATGGIHHDAGEQHCVDTVENPIMNEIDPTSPDRGDYGDWTPR